MHETPVNVESEEGVYMWDQGRVFLNSSPNVLSSKRPTYYHTKVYPPANYYCTGI